MWFFLSLSVKDVYKDIARLSRTEGRHRQDNVKLLSWKDNLREAPT